MLTAENTICPSLLLSQREKPGTCEMSFLSTRFLLLPVSQQGKEVVVQIIGVIVIAGYRDC